MTDIPVFFIEPADRVQRSLRRYRSSSNGKCDASGCGYCNAHTPLPDGPFGPAVRSFGDWQAALSAFPSGWPTHCACGYEFSAYDEWQEFCRRIYRRVDTGEEMTLAAAPVGAVWNADWFIEKRSEGFYVGPDGRCLVVKTPGGEWMIDSRANNCTMPDDDTHKCWVRHGRPEDGTLHVDKNGHTCAAGAGSILCGSYHGFLHHGRLTSC